MRTINPLNFFSPRLPSSPSVSESDESNKGLGSAHPERRAPLKKEGGQDVDSTDPSENSERESMENDLGDHNAQEDGAGTDEKTPLLAESAVSKAAKSQTPVIRKIASAVIGSFRVVVAAIFAPGRWLLACFYDDQGRFFAGMPFLRISRKIVPGRRRNNAPIASTPSEVASTIDSQQSKAYELNASTQDTSALTSESEPDSDGHDHLSMRDSPARNTRSKTPSASPESSEAPEKSIKIKAVPQEELRKRKQRRAEEKANPTDPSAPHLTVNSLKSPTGPTSALRLTKYPRAPAPPRPLIPRRQPSFSLSPPSSNEPPKTLVLDLDETLIHSMAKGGRMSTGHMVEVKLSSPVGVGNAVIAPQVPILYYVHKRPHCDEFLRKVSKWYNLIVFTASVQEYADPVIDWLELERKYFSARYYRQHCTYRNGAYIKDLSQVEPDLSKVMILDNSPICYIFHEDNAIPIEGWISDPTDNDLLHLIPLLEGLQHTTDVRALLALRLGESVS